MSDRILSVLAVDDSLDDLTLLQMAFRRNEMVVPLHFANSGEEALAYLEGKGKYADRQNYPFPGLIILDLKMPRVSGFDVLSHLRKLRLHPAPYVVVMSTSALQEDQAKAMQLGAFAFHTKPVAFTDLCEIVGRLKEFFVPYLTRRQISS